MSKQIGAHLLAITTGARVAAATIAAKDEHSGIIRKIITAKFPGKRVDELSETELRVVDYYANQVGFYMEKTNVGSGPALAAVIVKPMNRKQMQQMFE
jgi:hypothetical protein